MWTNSEDRTRTRVAAVLLGLGRAVGSWSRANQLGTDEEARLSRHAGGRI